MQILNTTSTTAYTGVLRSTYQIASGEGVLSLWRGMSSVIVGAGPAHAVYFATYEAVKHAMGGNQAGVHHPLAAGTKRELWPFEERNSCANIPQLQAAPLLRSPAMLS